MPLRGGGSTPNGKNHLKFPFWLLAHVPNLKCKMIFRFVFPNFQEEGGCHLVQNPNFGHKEFGTTPLKSFLKTFWAFAPPYGRRTPGGRGQTGESGNTFSISSSSSSSSPPHHHHCPMTAHSSSFSSFPSSSSSPLSPTYIVVKKCKDV